MAQHRSGDRMVMENGLDSLDHYEHDHDHADDGTIEHESRQNGTIELREEEVSVEKVFQYKLVPSWRNQLTLRAFTVSLALSILFTFIVMKLNLTVGIIPSLNVSAGLLGFFFVKTWTKFLEGSGMLKQPFTRQENTVIQTCVVASSGIAFSGGFGSYLFGMSKRVADQTSDSSDFKDLKLGWMIAFLFVVSFLGLFSVVPLRKIMVVDFKLTYPSGIATAHLINSFHTPQGAKLAKKQVKTLGKFFSSSFLWGFFQWFYTATDQCGFQAFPSLGLKAYQNRYIMRYTGYLSLASPCSMFMSQVIGIVMECVVSPCVFWIFYKAFPDLGTPNSEYPAPNAMVFMNMAILCVEGFKSLPKHCLLLCYILFGSAIVINMIKDFQGKRGRYIPLPMAMAIPFYLGSYFDIDMCVGSLILFVWEKLNKAKANAFGPAVASGLICGDGIWTLPSSILALAGVKPPIFMKFLSRATNARLNKYDKDKKCSVISTSIWFHA
ncbi:hypothetical protein Ahy_B05g074379 [Arachis hypogaea]|uniref:Metal-nicotianamine transporter n=1 Tax=Arachis hypogaea TaxID=3818 RepID=A0A444YYP8_ARAHY|nr:hypothetical protein Ahy_B05g074379 [Arachis hypogaea]